MEKKQSKIKSTAKERRKKFGKNVDMKWYYSSQGKSRPAWPKGTKIPKIMSNEDRRRLGISQDKDLPDYKEE